jgi:cell division protein FtsB
MPPMTLPAQNQIKYILLSLLFILATFNITKTTLDILQSGKRLENLKGEVSQLENKKGELEATLDYKKSDDYIEERARNALNLVKQNEKVYVAPNILGKTTDKSTNNEGSVSKNSNNNIVKSNPERWLELFF